MNAAVFQPVSFYIRFTGGKYCFGYGEKHKTAEFTIKILQIAQKILHACTDEQRLTQDSGLCLSKG